MITRILLIAAGTMLTLGAAHAADVDASAAETLAKKAAA